MKLTDFKALTFDCYGTLIDWESGMIAGLASLTGLLESDRMFLPSASIRWRTLVV